LIPCPAGPRPRRAGRPPGWPGTESLRLSGDGQGVVPADLPWATTRQPRGRATRRTGAVEGWPWAAAWLGCRRCATRAPTARSYDSLPCRSLVEKHLTQNQMFGQQIDQRSEPVIEDPLGLHQLVHQRLWTSSDVNPRISPVHGQLAGSGGVLTWRAATFLRPPSIHVVVPAVRARGAVSGLTTDRAGSTRKELAGSLPRLNPVGATQLLTAMGRPGRFRNAAALKSFTGLAPQASRIGTPIAKPTGGQGW
jgi:hypothetical protein